MKFPKLRLPSSAKSGILKAYLQYLAKTNRPIVCGPFRSEAGFEQLYWIPFLHWAQKYAGISPDRCIALSRGGMGSLYPAKHAVDLYALRGVDAVRLENQVDQTTRGIQKQTQVTQWDREAAKEAAKGEAHHLLHPSWMYWLFEDYWEERATSRLVANHTEFAPLPVPNLPDGMALPDKFVAVRFYERHTFPFHDEIKQMATEMVRAIASKHPVVLLNQQLFADDHTDLPIVGPNIYQLPTVKPEQNFLLQAAVLARAQAFVGTYGGVAQWALRYRKPSLSWYVNFSGTAQAHRSLSNMLSAASGVPFEVGDIKMIRLWQLALAKVDEAVEA